MGSTSFYADLPVLDDFLEVPHLRHYHELPSDWFVVVADVVGSTKAIENGQYRNVNTLGVSVITTVLNAVNPVEVPFVFGGDGATLCVPGSHVAQVEQALLAARMMGEKQFGLSLRVGTISVTDVVDAGHKVLVSRYRVSDHYVQAVFMGGGLQYAEEILKDPVRGERYRLADQEASPEGDFDGLECRWHDIPSPHGETVSLLVQASGETLSGNASTYREVLSKIHEIYGTHQECHPVNLDSLSLSLDRKKLSGEYLVRTFGKSRIVRSLYWVWLRVQVIIGKIVLSRGMKFDGVDWGVYKKQVVANTDYQKFDEMIREVLSGAPEQRRDLCEYLETRFQKGELVYGVHSSRSALMTCVIADRGGEHFHFVDGADGGYAMAAKGMKAQIKQRKASVPETISEEVSEAALESPVAREPELLEAICS